MQIFSHVNWFMMKLGLEDEHEGGVAEGDLALVRAEMALKEDIIDGVALTGTPKVTETFFVATRACRVVPSVRTEPVRIIRVKRGLGGKVHCCGKKTAAADKRMPRMKGGGLVPSVGWQKRQAGESRCKEC